MSTEDHAVSSAASTLIRSDPGWKYCIPLDGGTNKVVCKFCEKVMTAGITRGKEHLMGKRGKVAPCSKCPKEVREELWTWYREKEKSSYPSSRTGVDLGLGLDDDDDEEVGGDGGSKNLSSKKLSSQSSKSSTQRSQPNPKGKCPIDLFFRDPQAAIKQREKDKGRQMGIREATDKEAIARVHQYIARFFYQAGLSFNMVKLSSFQDMLDAIGAYGRHLPAPSYHAIRVPLLQKELENTEKLLKVNKEEWGTHGCSLMSDGWTDRKQRTIINFLVNSPSGSVFLKSIDASNIVKTGGKIFEMLDSVIEEIGEEKIVQVVTDNGSNYVAAGKMLMEKRKHLYWTPCAAHCLDLMLEDIGKIPHVKKTIQRAVSLVGFIYNHTSTLSLLRRYTNKRELVRPAVTRFATSFLSLERIHQEKIHIRKMFTSEEWIENKLSNEAKGREATKTVLTPSFWNNVIFTLKVMSPLVRVLRLVDGDKKPAMGYIFEAMEKAKETIVASFKNNESKYKEVFAIIDRRWDCQLHQPLHAAGHYLNSDIFYENKNVQYDSEVIEGLFKCIRRLVIDEATQDQIIGELAAYRKKKGIFGSDFAERQRKKISPAEWWDTFGSSAPHLQQFAIKVLSLTCSSSGCERNWSVFEQLHSKKRNRLEHKKLNDLVYVKYNQKLLERHKNRDELDPISLDDIDHCNEWLVGALDDDEDVADDLVFDDDTLGWDAVYEASGVGEPRVYTRHASSSKKRKEQPSGVSDVRAKKGKAIVVATEEDSEDKAEDDHHNWIDEASDDEEGEGYAPLDQYPDDYVGIEEDE